VSVEEILFGPFRLEPAGGQVTRDGAELDLRPQAVQALRTLLCHSGRHVSFEEMIREAWEGNLVSRHTVAVTVGEVKKALGEYGSWIIYRPKLGYRLEVPQSEDLIRKGWHFWNRQNREGLEKALCCFESAARQDGADFRAHEGIACSYLKLGTYGMRAPYEAYPRFLEAHSCAVALGGLTPELRTDRAIALHVFERKLEEAEAEMLRARRERPQLAKVYSSLILLYTLWGRGDDAAKVMAESRDAHELWPTFPAAEALIQICQRRYDKAIALASQAVELHPFLPLSRVFYAQALLYVGRDEEALEQYRLASVVSGGPAWVRALEGVCLTRLGRTREAREILDALNRGRAAEYTDAYHMALLLDALGETDQAFAELDRAWEENSASLCLLDADPKLDSLRADSRFLRIRQQAFGGAAFTAQRLAG
jgi:DNA-binding winged helix-turn-helix (wHTH) protein/tetratricopeptide (TPR) repeat protein